MCPKQIAFLIVFAVFVTHIAMYIMYVILSNRINEAKGVAEKVDSELKSLNKAVAGSLARFKAGDYVTYDYTYFTPFIGEHTKKGKSVIKQIKFSGDQLSCVLENGEIIPEDKAKLMCCKEKK